MSASNLKAKQKLKYNEIAIDVAKGKLGYVPAKKSRYSKTCSNKFSHNISFL